MKLIDVVNKYYLVIHNIVLNFRKIQHVQLF